VFFLVQHSGVPDFIVFKNGKRVESLMSDNPYIAKSLFDKYNIEKKHQTKVQEIENGDQFSKGFSQ
jgi:hypothetical protein